MSEPILALRNLADVEEIHTVAGDTCLVLKLRCSGPASLEQRSSRAFSRLRACAILRAMWCFPPLEEPNAMYRMPV